MFTATLRQDEINHDSHFRMQFMQMCQVTGVDPLASGKSFWGELLGGMNDYYYELAVQAVDICLRQRSRSGGLLKLSFVHDKIAERRSHYSQEVSSHDVEMAIGTLGVLGNGYKILHLKGQALVQSVPCELSADHSQVLELAEGEGYTTAESLTGVLGWTQPRVRAVLGLLLREGMAWVDDQAEGGVRYYFPSLWPQFNLLQE